MEILSISIDDETRRRLDSVQRKLGLKSRSKLLRDAIEGMVKDYEGLDELRGSVEIVFVLTYMGSEKNRVSNTLQAFKHKIKTELHQHGPEACIDVLTIRADASMVRDIFAVLKKNRCVHSIVYSVIASGRKGRKR